MEKQCPLDIPEILGLISSFVPAWQQQPSLTFHPRHLLSCTLVCKHWRRVMLPSLWAVYSVEHMVQVPIDVLRRNSSHFRHFYQGGYRLLSYSTPSQLWQKDSTSGLPHFQCTALTSFVLTPQCMPEQLELIRANRGIVSLDCRAFWAWSLSGTIHDTVSAFAGSITTLRLFESSLSVLDLISFLNNFFSLEHFQMGVDLMPLFNRTLGEWKGDGVQIQTLKTLTIFENIKERSNFVPLLSIFQQCPLKHIVLHLHNFVDSRQSAQSALQPLSSIHELVLEWNARQNQIATAKTKLDKPDIIYLSQGFKGLENLDIYLTQNLCARFQNGGRDLVTLKALIDRGDPQVVVSLIDSFRCTLRYVNISCRSNMTGYTAPEILSRLVGTLPELRRLQFAAHRMLRNEELCAIFKEGICQDDHYTTVARTPGPKKWACQHLERLAIRGSWATAGRYFLDRKQSAVVLKAACENHQWMASNGAKLDTYFIDAAAERLQTLPALNELTVGDVTFDYCEISSEKNQ